MKPIAVLGLVGVGLYLYSKYKKSAAFQSLNFVLSKADVSCSGFLCTSPRITLILGVQNPTDEEIVVKSLTGNVKLNGTFIGTVSSFNNKPIAANAETPYPVTIDVSASQVLNTIADIFLGRQGLQARIDLQGTVNTEDLLIPLNLTANLI